MGRFFKHSYEVPKGGFLKEKVFHILQKVFRIMFVEFKIQQNVHLEKVFIDLRLLNKNKHFLTEKSKNLFSLYLHGGMWYRCTYMPLYVFLQHFQNILQ